MSSLVGIQLEPWRAIHLLHALECWDSLYLPSEHSESRTAVGDTIHQLRVLRDALTPGDIHCPICLHGRKRIEYFDLEPEGGEETCEQTST